MDKIQLTLGEALLIYRRRNKESQVAAARRIGLTRNDYGDLERDADGKSDKVSFPPIGELTLKEKCLILRRRSGLTQRDCAQKIGVSRFWYGLMETGKVPNSQLNDFWKINDPR